MSVFESMARYGYGALHFGRAGGAAMQAIVAVHDTRLGPALGGCRFLEYASEQEAVVDVLRLARGMTYKAAITGIPHGGGKAVLIRPLGAFDRRELFRAFGRFVDELGGRYITAEDSGTTVEDMEHIGECTRFVTGKRPEHGGSGDPSPFTALGVRRGIEACVQVAFGRDTLEGIRVAVQGVGNVGMRLCRELAACGAELKVADVDADKAEAAHRELGAEVVPLPRIHAVECEVFAPCALGSVLDDETIPRLCCRIVAGAANNQLAEPRHGDVLAERGILFAPDYAINAGGLCNVAQEVQGYDARSARERVMGIYDTVYEIADRARTTGEPSHRVADRMVQERLAHAGT